MGFPERHKISAPAAVVFLPLFFIILIIICGCAAVGPADRPGPAELREAARLDPAGLKGTYIEGVPFFPQTDYMCGPAALASVVNYHGAGVGIDEVSKNVFHPGLKGTLAMDMFLYAKDLGFDVEHYGGGLDDLKARLSEKTPLILFLNLGHPLRPVGHFIVVLGYNDDMGVVVARWGGVGERVVAYPDLVDDWEKTGYTTLLIRPGKGADG